MKSAKQSRKAATAVRRGQADQPRIRLSKTSPMGSRAKARSKPIDREKLIPIVSDLTALHHCAGRTLCAMATSRSPKLRELTLADLRTELEQELVELEQAIEEVDILIAEQGADQKALRLDLEPSQRFAKIRARCAACD